MKVTLNQQDLLPALSSVSRSCGVRSTLPVLANILLSAQGNSLKLSATNLEIGVVKIVKAQVAEEGEITLPSRMFLEIISSLEGEITLEADETQAKISAAKFSGTLSAISASEFPDIPLSKESTLLVDAQSLEKSLPKISFAAATDEGRPILTGILTEIKKDSLELVATDGFRLAHQKSKIETPDSKAFQALIPKRTFEELVRLIAEEEDLEKVGIATSENQNQIIFTLNQTQLSSRLIEGQFPAWEKIIPASFENRTIVERTELLKALKLAAVFAKDSSNIVKLVVKDNSIQLSSEAKELGGQQTSIEAKAEGAEITIAFNNRFLVDALSAANTSQVIIEFSGNLSAALIKPMGDEGLEYIVMPVRLS